MTKTEIREAIAAINVEMENLAKTCAEKDVDVRPWASNDHPLSTAHWKLVQQRFGLKNELKKPSFSPERRAEAAKRLQTARMSSQDGSGERSSLMQIRSLRVGTWVRAKNN